MILRSLRKDYRDMFEKVQVDEAMHQRIMQNIRKEQEGNTALFYIRKEENIRKKSFFTKKYLSSALCAAVFVAVICTQVLPDPSARTGRIAGIINDGTVMQEFIPEVPEGKSVLPENPELKEMEEVDDLSGLEKAVGFPVQKANYLPFSVKTVRYVSYAGQLAEIIYQGESRSAVFRKAIGSEDISDDSGSYSEHRIVQIGNGSLALFGENELYELALWKDDTYTYSLQLSKGDSIEIWKKVYTGICGDDSAR